MTTPKLYLKEVLHEHLHLDLTRCIIKNDSTQVGGGGFSDVFRSKLRGLGNRRITLDFNTEILLNTPVSASNFSTGSYSSAQPTKRRKTTESSSENIAVAVKRLRFWDTSRTNLKLEKVPIFSCPHSTHSS